MGDNRKKINRIQSDLSSDDNIILADNETLKYASKPIGKAILRNAKEDRRPIYPIEESASTSSKCMPYDRVICKKCGKEFIRSNRSHHNSTQVHQIYEQLGDKVTNLLLDNKI